MQTTTRFLIAVLIAIAAFPLFAGFRLTPEQPVADPDPAAADGQRAASAVVSDGDGFMVFWPGPTGLNATPITADGKLAMATPHVVVPVASTIRGISACWTGSSYLVTWRDDNASSVYAAAVSREGNLVSPPRLVAQGAHTESGTLATNGRRALLAYVTGSPMAIRGALLATDGSVIAADIPLGMDTLPVVGSDGNEFALVWRTSQPAPNVATTPPPLIPYVYNFRLLRLSETGTVIGNAIDLGRTTALGGFGIAFGGGVYAIAAMQQRMAIARLTFDPRSGAATVLPAIPAGGFDASVYWNGSRFVAYAIDNFNPTSYTITTVAFSGQPEDVPPTAAVVAAEPHRGAALLFATNGRSALGVWSDAENPFEGWLNIVGQLFDAEATKAMSDRQLLSLGWSRQFMPAIATSGRESLVVWFDERGSADKSRVLAARIAANGVPIDRTPLVLASGTAASSLNVTFTGTTYVAAWQEQPEGAVVVRTIARDGSVGPRIALAKHSGVSIASSATTTLLVSTTGMTVVGYRFDPSGEMIDTTPIRIADGGAPQVASNGTDFLVAWDVGSDYWQFPTPNAIDVLGARVTASGAVDALPIEIATGGADQILDAIASDGRDYLVLYSLNDGSYRVPVLAAKRVLREGQLDGVTPTDPGVIVSTGSGNWGVGAASIVAGDNGFWVTWFIPNGVWTTATLAHTDARGNPGDVMTLMIDNTPLSAPSLAHAPGRLLEIAYSRLTNDPAYDGTRRVFVRFAGDLGVRSRAARH